MSVNLSELDRLYQEATKGEWQVRLSENATPLILHGDLSRGDIYDPQKTICGMPAEIMNIYNSHANAAIIVALHNSYPSLRARLQALEQLEAEAREIMRLFVNGDPRVSSVVWAKLERALSSLPPTREGEK